eukprot:TRINITY_DN11748_c0_g1_i1.p1 TRINITY_DN11748_c0_g1~~TRINITY_DN11748_c0_g1_i1.p1  ORF type:complete len:303 (-),score=58.38 TRINITY_DN11748_c0_g1_i1:140-1018(-)
MACCCCCSWWLVLFAVVGIAAYYFIKKKKVKTLESFESHVFSHEDIVEVVKNRLWTVKGQLRYPLERNMVIYRMPNNNLLLHSVIALKEETMKKLELLGKFEVMIVPNHLHRLDAQVYQTRYPSLKVVCPSESKKAVLEEIKTVDNTCEEYFCASANKSRGVTVLPIDGLKNNKELAYLFELDNGQNALIVTDLLWHNLRKPTSIIGKIFQTLFDNAGFLHMSRLGRWFMVKDLKALVTFLKNLASERYNIQVISMAHGQTITEGSVCAEMLTYAANRLLRNSQGCCGCRSF